MSSTPSALKRTYSLVNTPSVTNTRHISVATHKGALWSVGENFASGGDAVVDVELSVAMLYSNVGRECWSCVYWDVEPE